MGSHATWSRVLVAFNQSQARRIPVLIGRAPFRMYRSVQDAWHTLVHIQLRVPGRRRRSAVLASTFPVSHLPLNITSPFSVSLV